MKVCFVVCVLSTVVVSCSGENSRFEKSFNYSPGMMQFLRETLTDLSEEAHGYLVHLLGARSVENAQKCFFQVVKYLAEAAASGANVVMKYLAQFLMAAGVDVEMPVNSITPDAVVYIGQWLLLALIGYWLLSLAFRWVASTLRRVLWLLKLGVVLGLFCLILSDSSAGTETTALRLAGLVSVCVLLGIGHSGTGGDKTYLEDQVRVLERRVREMERRKEK
ncbi:transmembrane protein 109-like [Oncorhynchus keta]|uniref:transmembrane protein 109-like n=1 Tax=Oncorhynchus keta TaxID=8018 RepID=UPI0015F82E13|nr:transmembrane protein 109-like [Oncorhynchus keta]XP_046163810.1 transmembrane protein 109-like [Oncorhynchus gorbuscha]